MTNPMHYSVVGDLNLSFWSVRDGIQWHTWALSVMDEEHPINQILQHGKNPRDYYDEETVAVIDSKLAELAADNP
ncbi:hypothetical protein [Rhizobium sp. BK176]|uniref:hypothetical protein n=1 Tax=Rhizobium sp. BK176 TaxID=2587071 RepID=UPI002167A896|nr:hypothetical protein [Rhizobium sp. BK176]MCS4088553.1 hypothetical protein [Rhizobium sp. BK176]